MRGVELVLVPSLLRRFYVPRISSTRIDELISRADIVHVTGHWSVLGARVAMAARRFGKPYIYCPAGSLRVFGRSALLKKLFNWLVGHQIVRSASRCLTVTALEREQFHEYGVTDSQIVLLPNGVNPAETNGSSGERFRRLFGFDKDALLVLFLGRLSPIKGPDLLLEAFCSLAGRFPHVHLIFAGGDEELGSKLRAQARDCEAGSRIHFVGFLGGLAKHDALGGVDLLVVPSRQEAMSLVALEAGLAGTPVLLTDQCGFDDVAIIGGGRVASVTVESLAVSLEKMLNESVALESMGTRLKQLVLERYTWDGLTRDCLALYREIISESR
jgi:glycosyltransferase involved in cell wall biosynthesis